ncbi:hybrid histidine kinase/response regulator LvrA [Leptospira stimsonii]|uniref:histidine kinase n=1 Tax=Leptospira stimsonii TaxID=2202203 RepID=A0ABY2MVH4_9LEPT|nr:ATP-binding protein [Leptospira stimsonii]TGK13329.1 response regulator [Leptospira stimsonii]TGM09107.1 response regulator [Leptospira stimsonii]
MNEIDLDNNDFRLLFESLPGLYLILLPDFRITAVSDLYLQATNTKREEILGKNLFEVFPDNPSDPHATGARNLRESILSVLQEKESNTMAVQKYDVKRPESKGGGFEEKYWSPANFPVFNSDGEIIYIVHKAEDVTEFVRLKNLGSEKDKITEDLRNLTASMETEIYQRAQEIQNSNKKLTLVNEDLTRREEELKEVYQKLLEFDELKTHFFANVSHELRTPLTLILGPTRSLLKQENISPPQRNLLETIERNAYTLLKQVNDLLDISKLEAGRMALRYSKVDLSKTISNITAHFDSVAKERNLKFLTILPDHCVITIDVSKVERIILNLIANAFKFVPDSGTIRCELEKENSYVSIRVEDSGPGIPESMREVIFEKFRQGEEGDSRTFGGTGLGLAIVKEFVHLHSGTVVASVSSLGGALFEVRLPILEKPDSEIKKSAENEDLTPALLSALSDFKKLNGENKEERSLIANKRRVLIVEDNPEMRRYISESLAPEFQILFATNGKEGLEKALLEKPDVIVTDIMMPIMSGDKMVRAIREYEELNSISIIFLSAKADMDARIQLLGEGAQDYLIKPFAPEELLIRVRNFIRLKKTIETLETTNADMQAFSYSVSHDLRAPIRNIEGFLNILREDFEDKLDPEALRVLDIIRKSVVLMNSLIQDLLDFHKVSHTELNTRAVDMNSLVREVISNLTQERPEQNHCSIHVDSLMDAWGDGAALKQVWVNLISNAIKYSSKSDNPEVYIGCREEGEWNTFFVKDNGVGFDKKYANRLFKVFQRLHLQEEFEGTGVGLAIVARIIQRHGGKVFAEGNLGSGSIFSFTLPKIVAN